MAKLLVSAVSPASLLLLTTVLLGPVVNALDAGSLYDPRPGRWSLDQSGRLSSATLRALDDLGHAVKEQTGHEQVVVCVDSTHGENQRTFATRLFNRWGLGNRVRNDGVLLFVALGDRRVEFVLGDGIDDDLQVRISQEIVEREMLPRFRAGDVNGAVLRGAQAAAHQLLGYAEAPADPTPAPTQTLRIEDDRVSLTEQPIEWDANRPTPSRAPTAPSSPVGYTPPPLAEAAWVLYGLTGCGGVTAIWLVRRWLRNRPRTCPSCRSPMIRLGEHEDNQHLNYGEAVEERVGSVDYDIWCCTTCPHVVKLRYGAWFTSYARCPRCRAVTKSSNETTLIHATYDHGGQVRVDEACVACDYRNSFTRSTPQKVRSSNDGRSGISIGGFGGRGGSGGGGGGRSSGRGGGGGW